MNAIEKARELGAAIQADEKYINYHKAKELNDNDETLQEMIKEFNLKRVQLNSEMSKADKSQEKISELDSEIKSLYGNIMANENMNAFNTAKTEMDNLLAQVNMIITMSANGEDPMTCPAELPSSCSGSCSSCSGCH